MSKYIVVEEDNNIVCFIWALNIDDVEKFLQLKNVNIYNFHDISHKITYVGLSSASIRQYCLLCDAKTGICTQYYHHSDYYPNKILELEKNMSELQEQINMLDRQIERLFTLKTGTATRQISTGVNSYDIKNN